MRRKLSPGKRQYRISQLNRIADECRRAAETPAGKSLLDQSEINATPIIRYRNYCSCGDAWLSDKQESQCRRFPLCKSMQISYEMLTDPAVKS